MDQHIEKQNSRDGFPVRRSLMKTLHPVSQTLVALEMNLTSSRLFSSDQLEYVVHLPLSSVSLLLLVSPKLRVSEKNKFSHRPCTYSGEASIFCNSPSSRSESAMLSAES